MSICKRCNQPIEFRLTAAGRHVPVDVQPVALLTRRGAIVHGWVVHFATCALARRRQVRELHIYQECFQFVDGQRE